MPQMKRIPEYLKLLQKGADPDSVLAPSNEVPEPTGDYRRIQEYGKGAPKEMYESNSDADEANAMEVFKKYNPNQPSLAEVLSNKKKAQEEDANFQESLKEFQQEPKDEKMLPKLRKLMGK